ncbi:unnamed protein product [Schistosoma turkestanicum]|nr:unnamed protein product [Schistosoma turkestanicum]
MLTFATPLSMSVFARDAAAKCGSGPLDREYEYRYINSLLEAKTNDLLRNADEILAQEEKGIDECSYIEPNHSSKCHSPITEKTNLQERNSEHNYDVTGISSPVNDYNHDHESYSNKDEISELNVLPEPAEGLSLKAQNRYLKAKVRVLLEENQKLNSQMTHQNDEIVRMKNRIQELEEERNRLHRVTSAHSTQLEKMKKSLGETRIHCNELETEKTNYKKDYDSIKRSSDQQAVEIKSLTTRLNRAIEESDRYKADLDKVRSSTRESVESMRRNIENIMAENKRLEKQKSELISAFKKQMKLIDILRRQKMLVEASKCLHITEEEFMKALDL